MNRNNVLSITQLYLWYTHYRSASVDPGLKSPKFKMSQRPKLKRETAQDIEDTEIDSNSGDQRMVHLSPNIFLKANRNRLIHQKSAPGTPLSPKRINYPSPKTPSRTPSDESSTSGFLSVPKQRLRGSSFSGDLDFSSRKVSRGFVSQLDRILTILSPYLSPWTWIHSRETFLSETVFHSNILILLFQNIQSKKQFGNLLQNTRNCSFQSK